MLIRHNVAARMQPKETVKNEKDKSKREYIDKWSIEGNHSSCLQVWDSRFSSVSAREERERDAGVAAPGFIPDRRRKCKHVCSHGNRQKTEVCRHQIFKIKDHDNEAAFHFVTT